MARELQSLILPASLPVIAGLEIGVRTRQAQVVVGGDYYDAVVLPDGRLGVCCADVSGKGVPGQLRLPLVKYAFRVCAREFAEPAAMVTRLNQILCDELPDEIFVPLVYTVFDPAAGTVELVGKHCPPCIWWPAPARCWPVSLRGVALGVVADAVYGVSTIEFAPDDYLVLYSDGAIEAQDRRGEELGEAGLAALLAEATPESAQDLANWLFQALDEHEVGAKRDDLTLVVVRRTKV
ncbi:MAG: serine/threonine-protein phosphatase [Gammaproteobacteria bacterium]|nr:serine/threonine-protein phosphatase [Gammaproteobacteria bacterium]